MRIVKSFEEFISKGVVRSTSPDMQRAQSLRLESDRKLELLGRTIEKMTVVDENANDYVEYCYNILMLIIRARMLESGFKSSGRGAHEAEVAFGRLIGLGEPAIRLLDQLRHFRNGILYYGKQFDKEYAEKIISFTKKNYSKIKTAPLSQ